MATSARAGRPTPAQGRVIRRRRSWAALAVVLCIAADGWSVWSAVSPASAREPVTARAPHVPAHPSSPVPSTAEGEDVPAGPDSPMGSSTPAALGNPGARAGAGDGRDEQGTVIESGSGTFTVVSMPASALRPTRTGGRVVRYTVEVEGGIDVPGDGFATTVGTVLTDPRGWQTKDGVRFVDVPPADAAKGAPVDLRVTLASPDTTDRLCAPLQTRGQVSCHNGNRVVLNARRWVLGAQAYGSDLAGYRTYLVNHEVGHGIGHPHEYCGGTGQMAPVMMQQTYGLKGCTAWPWPTAKPE